MKKIVFIGIGTALLLFTGCSKKTPEVDMTKNAQMSTQQKPQSADTKISNMNSQMSSTGMQSANNGNNVNKNSVNYQIAQLEQEVKIIHFNFNKYNIRKDQKPLVVFDAKLINSPAAKDFSVKLEGNCDEWGSDEYNYALGLRRANRVKTTLSALGVNTSRLMIISYGKSNPVCTQHTRACWAKNRRVDFEFLP